MGKGRSVCGWEALLIGSQSASLVHCIAGLLHISSRILQLYDWTTVFISQNDHKFPSNIRNICSWSHCFPLKLDWDYPWECSDAFDDVTIFMFATSCSFFFNFLYCWYRNSAGHVYLCFESVNAAMDAQRALHGRWFAGKMITATFMVKRISYSYLFDGKMSRVLILWPV